MYQLVIRISVLSASLIVWMQFVISLVGFLVITVCLCCLSLDFDDFVPRLLISIGVRKRILYFWFATSPFLVIA